MKLSFVLFFIGTVCLYANTGYSQDTRVNLHMEKATLTDVFREIEKQSDYRFFYNNAVVSSVQKVNLNASNETISSLLKDLFLGTDINYRMVDNYIVITRTDDSLDELLTKAAVQGIHITGTVSDENGEALPGVNVLVKGTIVGTVTDANGKFSISVPNDQASLVFSFIGFSSTEVVVGSQRTINVTLAESFRELEEVVVVGYATQKRVNLSGSVSTVSPKVLTNRPVTSLTNALQGTIPGMTVISRPGDVGSDLGSINVRGRGNFGSASPLYVVDGVPVSGDDFARINPNDVEAFSVLKDASASSIYGSRAAYGVILVTTKRGKAGTARVQYTGNFGWQSATYLPDILGSYDYATLYNEALRNAGKNLRFTDAEFALIASGTDQDRYPDTDWYREALHESAPMWDSQISVTGGNDMAQYYVSAGYSDQNSLIPEKDLKRYSFRANINSKLSEYFSMGANASFVRDQMGTDRGTMTFTSLNRMLPLMPVKQSDGSWATMAGGQVSSLGSDNPIRRWSDGGRSKYYQNRFIGNLTATLTPIKGWNIDGLLSYRLFNTVNSTFTNKQDNLTNFETKQSIPNTGVTPNQLDEKWQNVSNLLTQLTTSYELNFARDHYAKVLLGGSYEYYSDAFIQTVRKVYVNNSLNSINGGSADPLNTTATGNPQQRAFASFFGRLNYAFMNRYLAEASIRVDNSSQFAPGNRTGVFPSGSVAWRISQEHFMSNISWIQELKLRASIGKLGNVNNVGFYDFYDGLASGIAYVLDQKKVDGVWPNKVANPDLKWETINMTDIGIDASLFRNKLWIQADWYNKYTHDILFSDPNIPSEAGLVSSTNASINQTPSRNLGEVRNRGIELNLSYNDKIGRDFTFSIGGNISKIWNRVMKIDGTSDFYTTGTYYIVKVGEPIGSFYMYESDGLFATNDDVQEHASQSVKTQAGDIKFVNHDDSDNVIDGKDRVITGNDVPYLNYGINLNLGYKGFELSVIGVGVPNVKVYIDNEGSQPFFNGAGVRRAHLDRWTAENPNPNANMSRMLLSADATHNNVLSDFWLYNASYFRIKSLTLAYNLPQVVLNTLRLQDAKVYVSSNNLLTIRGDKRMKDFDPEMASVRATYPQLKTISLGLSLTF